MIFIKNLIGLKEYLTKAINEKSYSKIVIYYNHYYNFSKSEFTSMQVFPVVYDESAKENVDFLIETDIKSL